MNGDDKRHRAKSFILHTGRPGDDWPLPPECLPFEETLSVDIRQLVERDLLDWTGKGFVLTDRGQAIYDRLITGQPVPDDWWNGISD
jgi:hypothetical protein